VFLTELPVKKNPESSIIAECISEIDVPIVSSVHDPRLIPRAIVAAINTKSDFLIIYLL
jgi:hypothetical protein